jgi:hypothetical protein
MSQSFHLGPLGEKVAIGSRELVRASHAARDNQGVRANGLRAMAKELLGVTGKDRCGTKDHSGVAATESNAPIRPFAKKEPLEPLSKELRIPESRIRIQWRSNRDLRKAATENGATRIAQSAKLHPKDGPTADHHVEAEQKAS